MAATVKVSRDEARRLGIRDSAPPLPAARPPAPPAPPAPPKRITVRRDEEPASAGPKGSRQRSAVERKARSTIVPKVNRALRRTAPRRALVAELVAVLAIMAFAKTADTKGEPTAQAFVPAFVVFFVLAVIAEAGDGAARVSVAMGALVLSGVVISHYRGIVDGFKVVAKM